MAKRTATDSIVAAGEFASRVRAFLTSLTARQRQATRLDSLHTALSLASNVDGDFDWFAHQYATALATAATLSEMLEAQTWPEEVLLWLVDSSDPLVASVLVECLGNRSNGSAVTQSTHGLRLDHETMPRQQARATRSRTDRSGDPIAEAIDWFEAFLTDYDGEQRMRRGVFFTPRVVARYIIESVERELRESFSIEGLIATGGVLDPAVGAGVFPLAVIDAIERNFLASRAPCQTDGNRECDAAWQQLMVALLPKLVGFELLLPAAVAAQLILTARLIETGVRFPLASGLRIHVINTLGDLEDEQAASLDDPLLSRGLLAANAARLRERFPIVVGNPPFSGISNNATRFSENLLRGRAPDGPPIANYYEVDGQPLGERKHWLHDDYVKFLRYAHWQVERAGVGLVGFVTNHGYLDNVTLRGVRRQLMTTFSRIDVLDLHGNRKKLETHSGDVRDESVFAIDQGTAIGLFSRPPRTGDEPNSSDFTVRHGDLWGSCESKLARLNVAAGVPLARLQPAEPFYFFARRNDDRAAEYATAMKLTDIMPVNSTAAVTARDGFAIALDERELRDRLAALVDPALSDEAIRERFFQNGRSPKYLPGDTRGWKLAEARRRLRELADPAALIRTCHYRPFDRRAIIWCDWMIDWPRSEIMRHLLDGNNLALVTRRQTPAARPCDYFFIADGVVIDGLIRSDNRGSESFFPLYLQRDRAASLFEPAELCREVNLSPEFLGGLSEATGLQYSQSASAVHFTAEQALHFIYAQFHASEYRGRFAELLNIDFPRVFLPAGADLFRQLATLGARLAGLHLQRGPVDSTSRIEGELPPVISAGFPSFADGRVYLSQECWLAPVDEATWTFQVGAWQVCRKWLVDRRGRKLSAEDVDRYRQIVAAASATRTAIAAIDERIRGAGGWPNAFVPRP